MSQPIPLPLLPLCLALCLGRASQTVYALPFAAGALVLAAGAERTRRGRFLAALLLAFAAGGVLPKRVSPPVPSFPAHVKARIFESAHTTEGERQAVELEILAVRPSSKDPWRTCAFRVGASLAAEPRVVRGDVIEAAGRFRAVEPPANPSDRFGRSPRFVVAGPHVHRDFATPLRRRIAAAQRTIYRGMGELSEPGRSVARALFLGARREMPEALRRRWAAAGLAHLLAISGLHVTLVGGAVYGIVAGLAWGIARAGVVPREWRRVAAMGAFSAALAYCLWVGAPTSAVRAVVMAGAMAFAAAAGSAMSPVQALVIAFTGIVVHDDRAFGDLGLWLSVVAVAALLAPSPARGWRRWTEALIAPSVATAPIVAGTFGSVAWASPLANAFALPWATFVLTPLALGHGVLLGLGVGALAPAVEASASLVDAVAAVAATVEATSARRSSTWIVFLTAAATGSAWLSARPRWVLRGAVVSSLLVQGGGGSGLLRLTHIAVGQGDSTLLQLPDGEAWLVDGGGRVGPGHFDPGRYQVVPALLDAGVTELHTVIATHGDADHVRGLHAVFERIPVRRLLWNGSERTVMRELVDHARHLGTRVEKLETGWRDVRGSVSISVDATAEAESENDASLVTFVHYRTFRAALPGDIGVAREEAIDWPELSVLLAPHHGSRSSSGDALLRAAKPRWVIVSAGRANRYGMPHASVLERYRAAGTLIWRMDERGQLRIESDGERFWGWGRCAGLRGCDPRRGSLRP